MCERATAGLEPRLRGVLGSLRRICAGTALASVLLVPGQAAAATWAQGTTPRITQLFAVDATGEPDWPFGFEDIAGDGATFAQQEQSVDLRTAYAATDAQRVWLRAYVSSATRPAATTSLYVFIDSDHNANTGGDAIATAVDAQLDADPSPGGYEYLVGVNGNAQILGVWQWDAAQSQWVDTGITPAQAAAEVDTDLDPIRWTGDTHGYLQASVDLGSVGLTQACDAVLFTRSVNSAANLSDLDLGAAGACVPNANANGVPDLLNASCTTNADCPAGGACIGGNCQYTPDCTTNADCAADQVCTAGRCVAAPGGTCTTNADCNGLVCQGGQCVACTASSQCASGQSCAPDGTCVTGSGTGAGGSGAGTGGSAADLAPGEEIQGGACACSLPRTGSSNGLTPFALGMLLWGARRRRRRS